MGGKSYYCDYCQCYMKNDINVRKTHNLGLAHKIAKVSYTKRFEDPRILYEEEISKTPCTRYLKGFCKFDWYCQYSHYSKNQLNRLKKLAKYLKIREQKKSRTQAINTTKTVNLNAYIPWLNNDGNQGYVKSRRIYKNLPPSLKQIDWKKMIYMNYKKFNQW